MGQLRQRAGIPMLPIPSDRRGGGHRCAVGPTELRRYWRSCAGRVELGEAWRQGQMPAPIATGPQKKGVGRKPHSDRRDVRRAQTATWPGSANWNPDEIPIPAVIMRSARRPVLVRGVDKGILGPGQYAIVNTLVNSTRGLTLAEIARQSGVKAAKQILIQLRKDPDWRSLIAVKYGPNRLTRYRIPAP